MNNLIKILLICLLGVHYSTLTFAQNLVPNPSFEDTTNCSIDNQIFRTPPWQQPTAGSSDWLNPCSSSLDGSTVPNNEFGVQNAQDGASYAGFILYTIYLYYKEYIQVQLTDRLVAGTKYWVRFHISLADSSKYAIKEIGAYFSDTAVYSSDIIPLPYTPQVKSSGTFLTDKMNWVSISGTFIANGGEKFITLGNFQDSTTIDILNVGGSGIGLGTSYYYIDNICISDDSTVCGFSSDDSTDELNHNIMFYPNPFSSSAVIVLTPNMLNDGQIYYSVYDMMGNLVRKEFITQNQTTVNRDELSSGIYLITLVKSNKILFRKKIIIN